MYTKIRSLRQWESNERNYTGGAGLSVGNSTKLFETRLHGDNPFIESFFKTVKYTARYPQYFTSIEHATVFIDWYNSHHYHSGLQYITPVQKRKGEHRRIFSLRNKTLCRVPIRCGNRDTRKYVVKEQEILNPKSTGFMNKTA